MGHEEGEEASVAVTNYRVSRRIMRRSLLSRFTVTLINSKKPHLPLFPTYIYTYILKIGEWPFLVHRFSKPPPLVTSLLRENRACLNKRGDVSPTPPRSTRVSEAENRSHFRGHGVHVREHEGGTREDGQAGEVRWHGIPSGEKRHRSLTASLTGAYSKGGGSWLCNGIVAGHARGQGPFGRRVEATTKVEIPIFHPSGRMISYM